MESLTGRQVGIGATIVVKNILLKAASPRAVTHTLTARSTEAL